MNTIEAIKNRRSVRKYKADEVSDEHLQILLEAAMLAPSAGNAQPWEFIIVKSKEAREKIAQVNPFAQMAIEAPLSIIVCGNLKEEKYPGFWQQDCSAALQNLMLAAVELGLGTVWTGVYPVEERVKQVQEYFNMPEHILPMGIVVVGHPDQKTGTVDRFKAEKIHNEKY